ncbi:MAG TPA: hypothetical protein DCS82_07585 [Rhodospirillaceae bacterium]|nr:hypothetical protein [Rhodospirillaceae bacterium]
MCAKYQFYAHYPSDFVAIAHALYIVFAGDCRRNLSDRVQNKETKGFCTRTTREHSLEFVYKRSIGDVIRN